MVTRSELAKWSARLPLLVSFAILGSTYALFLRYITLGEVWKRGPTWRFAEQLVLLHGLYGLSVLSLITAAYRSPGYVPQHTSLGRASYDEDSRPFFAAGYSSDTESESADDDTPFGRAGHGGPGELDEDDVPLSAILAGGPRVKTRPPPLDLGTLPLPRQDEILHHPLQTAARLTMALNPLVPNTATDAGTAESLAAPGPPDIGTSRLGLLSGDDTSGIEGGNRQRQRRLDGPPYLARPEDGIRRYCSICEAYKPDRAHHCRHCRRCVKRMDHHCIWVNNCVGADNYKPFLLFITYSTLICLYIFVEAGAESLAFFQDPERFYSSGADSSDLSLDPVVYMLLALLAAFMGLAVGSLAAFHWYLACQNLTTLDNMSYSYPTALLPLPAPIGITPPTIPVSGSSTLDLDCHSPAASGTEARVWKADHLLTRPERIALRNAARPLRIFDLGWRQNLARLLLPPPTQRGFLSPSSHRRPHNGPDPPAPASVRQRPPLMALPLNIFQIAQGSGKSGDRREGGVGRWILAGWPGARSTQGWADGVHKGRLEELREVTGRYRLGLAGGTEGGGARHEEEQEEDAEEAEDLEEWEDQLDTTLNEVTWREYNRHHIGAYKHNPSI